ncbi:hypothetical protein PFICI_08245 [Pestalotiopsis fici W106-1]|uniref:Zn(2)-C6 fungal-type domain-containing protein n=1 Tax=Pestalotiopsis fici (strain W106-1 / CGMCC3.15140) TaxID=1229662 RepID=W3X6C6_PESFW|nr:uncharacterized protein PFICI_08245 [Pestalotiopsis fici W106-1]ETS80716.1 hypothetical protein PFICI_08245 [Pestalotiopsis fici W106-1]
MEDNRESSHDSVEILEQQPAKRRRIALACGSCRDRKTRCDGQKPVCGPCTKRGNADSECAYAVLAGSAKRQSEQEYISCLQQEIRDLRQALTSRQNRESAPLVPQIRTTAFSVSPGRAPAPTSTLPQSLQSAHQYDPRRIPAPQDGSTYPDPSSILPYSVQGDASPLPVLSNPQSSTHPVADVNPRSDVGSKRQTTSSRHGVSPRVESAAQNTEMTPVNAMGAATSIWSSSSRNREFFGQSSIVSLLEQVAHPVLQASSYAAESTSARSDIPAPRRGLGDRANEPTLRFDGREGSLSGLLGAQYSLPPRDVADELFNNYYANVHIFYPWTHPARVRKTYESIWALQDNQPQEPAESFEVGLGSPCPQRIFFLALNAMFALGLQFSRFDAAEKEDASKMFYRRMEELVNMELVGGNSLAHVQAFLLVGQYLLCTQYPSRCWNVSGLACRMAMGLGLQTKTYPEGLLPIEVEIRRRVWYGCAQMDMFISMMLGRKPSTSMNLEVPLPTPVDDEVLERVGSPNSHTKDDPSINAFMVENIRLTRILGNILDVLYETTPKDPNRHLPLRLQGSDLNCEDFNAIASLDGQLNRFTKELPAFLQQNEFEPMQSRDRRLVRQTEVLHARYVVFPNTRHR